MATNFTTYEASSNREDLNDEISNISRTATPFFSMAKQVEATNKTHEWQIDELASVNPNNAVIEGADAGEADMTGTDRVQNQCQLMEKVVKVSSSQRASDAAGKADEMDYQVMKKGKELKRDVETILLSNQAKALGDSSNARKLGGIQTWISTNVNAGVGATEGNGKGDTARVAGTPRSYDESQLKDVIAKTYEEGGEPDTIMLGTYNKGIQSSFNSNATLTRNVESASDKLNTSYSIYGGDFGDLKIVPNIFMDATNVLVLDSNLWKVGMFQGFATEDLAKQGHSDRKMLSVELTLHSTNEKGNGAIYDTTTSA